MPVIRNPSRQPVALAALVLLLSLAAAAAAAAAADDPASLKFHASSNVGDHAPLVDWRIDQPKMTRDGPASMKRNRWSASDSASAGWQPSLPTGDQISTASVVHRDGRFVVVPDYWAPDVIAYGRLVKSLNTTGWDILDVATGMIQYTENDTALMYAAGLLEGYLTGDRIGLMYTNMMPTFFPTDQSRAVLLPRVRDFLSRQFQWAKDFATRNPSSAVARHTGFVLAQLQGLIDGYLSRNDTQLKDPFVLHLLNAVGDMLDLQIALNDTMEDHFNRMTDWEFENFVRTSGRCSALIRVTPGLEQLFMGHSSWFVYGATLRIYKHYYLYLADSDMASNVISFSSYPGFLESLDDFYIMDSGIVLLQTTNNVFNVSLYKYVKPQSLLAWQRVRVANQIARNGSHWAWVMNQQNSGTYNNQYMVIDMNQIKPNESINDGALTIVEQIPSLVMSSDQTGILRTGYFPSYNVPFHEKIYNMSGYPDVVQQRGLGFSYQMAPRAKIFRREAPLVTDAAGMAGVLRFNRFADDPYSEGSSCNSICCRGDLGPGGGGAFGCYDSKFSEYSLARHMVSYAISGPTIGDEGHRLPPFSWKQYPNASHAGLPFVYNFKWMTMSPYFL